MMTSREQKNSRKNISYLEIFLLIVSVFAFSYIVYEGSEPINEVYEENKEIMGLEKEGENNFLLNFIKSWFSRSKIGLVSAQQYNETLTERAISEQDINWNCCPEDKKGNICQDVPPDYKECKISPLPTKCEQVSSCKLGCCFDVSEGLCTPNSPKERCESGEGKWQDNKACNIQECSLSCCVLGSDTQFVTEKRCERLSGLHGFGGGVDFRPEIGTELECLALSYSQTKGACVIEEENEEGETEKGCKFISKQECLSLSGSSSNFHENLLCTNPALETNCEKTKETTCGEGKDEVYFVDSCGNVANVYDASKVDNEDYWNKIVKKEDSCDNSLGSIDSQTCGNCNRFLGSFCGEGKAEIGNFVCKDLNCEDAPYVVDASGKILNSKNRKNGEAWCVYDSYIGEGKDVVGSRHFKYYCQDGEVKSEPCSDYRQEICVQSDIEANEKTFSNAACRVNRWRECLDYNNLAEKQGDKVNYEKIKEKCQENSDCYLKELDFGKGYNFFQCLPNYPSGFDLNAGGREEINAKVCSMANFDCVKVEVKEISGWKCVAGCDCDTKKYTQQMNDWCVSLGDCGGYVNILGEEDNAYSIDRAPKIDLTQYKKNINPVEGQKAEPGDISEMLLGQMGLEFGEEGYVGEGETEGIMSLVPRLMGIAGVAYIGALATGGMLSATGPLGVSIFVSAGVTGSTSVVLGAIGNVALGAAAGAIAGMLIGKMFGLQGQALEIMAAGGALTVVIVSILAKSASACIGPQAPICLLIIVILAIILKVLGIGETRETHVRFNCYPWEAPSGGKDCEKCGDNGGLKECSKYRCESLGQACELINQGTQEEKCFWNNKNDVSVPKLSPWQEILTPGYKYDEVSENGFKIKTEQGECIQAYTPLLFGISTDELSQCKFDVVNAEYENLEDYFGLDNLYRVNHSMPFTIPSMEAIANEFNLTYQYVLDKIGDMRFYVKCQDKNGNKNIAPYLIDICIKPGPDKTAPMILGIDPATNSYVKFDVTRQDATLYVNEPSECKWDLFDRSYENLENNMSCLTGLQQASLFGWPCSTLLPLNLSLQKFYFRCKDQPWLTGTINETNRNTNQQSFVYELKKSISELKITKIEPNGTITGGVEPFSVTLKAHTSGGAENGKASCNFKFSEDGTWIQFRDTFSNTHEQVFSQMLRGRHIIYVRCEDIAGNGAEDSTNFKLNIDTSPPKVVRVYNDGILKIITDENAECKYGFETCNFIWGNGTKMESSDFLSHKASWEQGKTYYIKCEDKFGKKPGGCSIIVKAV